MFSKINSKETKGETVTNFFQNAVSLINMRFSYVKYTHIFISIFAVNHIIYIHFCIYNPICMSCNHLMHSCKVREGILLVSF